MGDDRTRLYAIVDENMEIVRHQSKGTLGIFSNIKVLKNNAWRYVDFYDKTAQFSIAEVEVTRVIERLEEGAE